MDDRRREQRCQVTFPVMVGSHGRFFFMTKAKNVSSSGLLVMTAVSLDVGESVSITYEVGEGKAEEHNVKGRIIRVEKNDGADSNEWPFLAAVEFSGPQIEIEQILKGYLPPGDAQT